MRSALFLAVAGVWISIATPSAVGQDAPPAACTDCHNGVDKRPGVAPPQAALAESVHAILDCTDCHLDVSMDDVVPDAPRPHGDAVARVDCTECHADESEVYKKHGRLDVGSDPDIPRCQDCHGGHDVFPSKHRRSHTHIVNLPDTCRSCHTNVDIVAKHEVLRRGPIDLYESSVHGRATQKGIHVAATCSDCHSSSDETGNRTAHRILSPADPESTIYHFNIPDTCGKCHEPVTRDFWEGIHGQFVKRGSVDAPVCTHCHGEHGIVPVSDPRSPVSPAHLAEQTCAPCHESATLNEKYGLAGGRLASYIDSYHGLKSKAGDATVANCASCHGAHRILPSTDPTSSIHPDNLRNTCGDCHPRISTALAQTKIHSTSTGLRVGWPEFFRRLYIVLIIVTIGGMLLHNGADFFRRTRSITKEAYVQRLSPGEVAQHWVLMLSFTVLVLTGFSLRFSEAGWVRFLFGWEGGFEMRGTIHRVSGIVLIASSIWHVIYLFTRRGRRAFSAMCVRVRDVRDFWQNVRFFLGRRDTPPAFDHFSYMEKAEYWALLWGTVIMTLTGLLLWFDDYFVESWGLPKGVLDVMLVIHYWEAWLATLAIVVWHLYSTIYSPAVYPMNPAWISGKMPHRMYAHEHADGPPLKRRITRPKLAEELEDAAAIPAPDATGSKSSNEPRQERGDEGDTD